MNMLIKKKQLLTATLVVALGAAVAVNWYYSEPISNYETTTATYEEVEGALGDSIYVAGTTSANEEVSEESEDESDIVVSTISDSQAEYFADAKLERDTAHAETIENIEAILENENLSESQKEEVRRLLEQFSADVKAEIDVETLITAKTSSECVVIINNDYVQVIMQQNTLSDTVLLQISEIIEKNTNICAENLTIIEAK